MERLKKHYRLFSFFYTKNDIDPIDFSLKGSSLDLQIVKKSMTQCKSECEELLYTLLEINYNEENEKYIGIYISKTKFNNIAMPLLSKTVFFINFFGLICLFFKLSFISLVFKANKAVLIYLKNKLAIQILITLLNLSLVSSFFFCYFYTDFLYKNYVDNTILNYVYREVPFQPAVFSAAICRHIHTANSSDFKNLSLTEIENRTSDFNLKDNFVIKFNEEKQFKNFNFRVIYKKTKRHHLDQCFQFGVSFKELRYRAVLSMTTLVINSTYFDYLYLSDYNRSISSKDKYFSEIKSLFRIEKNNVLNCTNYSFDVHRCVSQKECKDKCFINEYLKFYKKLPFNYPIYCDNFEAFEKRSLFFDENENENTEITSRFKEKCKKKFNSKDCKISSFFSNYEDQELKKDSNNYTISLYFEQVKSGQAFKFSVFQLIFLLNLLFTIAIGVSFPNLCNFLVFSINFLLKPEDKLSPKNLIFLFSLIGSSVHVYYLAKETCFGDLYINIDLQLSYLLSNDKIPNLLFCLKHDLKFRENELLTGNLLDKKTEHLNESYLFKEIQYYDLNAIKQFWTPKNKKISENFRIEYFFLLDFKCFEIRYKMNSNHINNGNILSILKIQFNQNIAHQRFLFTSKLNSTFDFSEYYNLNVKDSSRIYFSYYSLTYYNRYQTLTNPSLWLSNGFKINDINSFMNQIKKEFKNSFNYSTKLVPLMKTYFNLKINDALFEQFNIQYVSKNVKNTIDYNYERTFFFSKKYSLRTGEDREEGSLIIDKVYYSYYITFTNRSDFFLNLLNIMFLWFNIYINELINLISSFASFFLIFKLKNIKNLISKIRHNIDHYFVREKKKHLAPISSLKNLSINNERES